MPRVKVYKDVGGSWRWHVEGDNHEVMFQGEGHPTWDAARDAARAALEVESDTPIDVAAEDDEDED